MRIQLTRTDCQAIAVAEAIVAKQMGLEGVQLFTEEMDLKKYSRIDINGRTVIIKTPEYHEHQSLKFVVEVGFLIDEDFDCAAELWQEGKLLRKFWWSFSGSKIELLENPDIT